MIYNGLTMNKQRDPKMNKLSKITAAVLLMALSSQVMAECQPVGVNTEGTPVYQCTYNTTNMAPIQQQVPPVVIQGQAPVVVQQSNGQMVEGVLIGAVGGLILGQAIGGHHTTVYQYGRPYYGRPYGHHGW
jgi:outer membrane lipoprotein SlyB